MKLDACWRCCGSGSRKIWWVEHAQVEISPLTGVQKYVKGKPCKPYNSTLGEFFRVSIIFPGLAFR